MRASRSLLYQAHGGISLLYKRHGGILTQSTASPLASIQLASSTKITYTTSATTPQLAPSSLCNPPPIHSLVIHSLAQHSPHTTRSTTSRSIAPIIHRAFSQSAIRPESPPRSRSYKDEVKDNPNPEENDDLDESKSFKRSEKASQAAQLNLSAKLSHESGNKAGKGEITRLLRIARPELKTLSWAFLFLLVSSSISMSLPFSIGKILDTATNPDADTLFGLTMPVFYATLASILAVGAAANYGRIIVLRIVGERIVTKLRSQLFRRTFIQDAEFFDANRTGDLISRLGSDTIIVGKSITQNVSDGLRSLVSAVAGFGLMGYVSLKLTGILALMFPPVAIGAFFYGRAIRNLSRRIQKNLGTLTKIAEERLGNVRTAQAFAGELQEVHRYNTQVRKIFNLGKKEAYISAIFFSSSGFMGNMTFLALLYFGGSMVKSGAISVGELSSFLMYTAYAGSSLFGLSSFYSELMKGVGAATRLFELQDREPTISPTKGEAVKSARGDIHFQKVKFSYPTRPAVTIFDELDFTIKQGTNVAIVAPSGAGKSTVASLIMRFYSPTSGTVLIGDRDISKMNAKQLRRKIGYVGQEPVLFSGSIAENIAYGRPWATKQEIVAAARKANCTFISDFPEGLETHVGARGTQLSGGQKQRLAIARALLKEPDILILDEATSALDAESETLVNSALSSLLEGNNTTISIAHRLSTIKRSDTIICISNDGKVAETGTFEELSQKKEGAFKTLMEWQLSGNETRRGRDKGPIVTDEEAMEYELERGANETEELMEEEGANTRKSKISKTEAVVERVKPNDRDQGVR